MRRPPTDRSDSRSGTPLFLSSAEVRRLVPMRAAIDAASKAFPRIFRGEFIQPPRLSRPDGSTLVMVAKKKEPVGTVIKVLTIRPDNPRLSLPTIHSTVLWIDDSTGQLVDILD